jgi:hypothetical protein
MQFIRIGEYLAVSRITGPRHNLLQLRLASERQATAVECEKLPPVGSCVHAPLDEQTLIAKVLEGVALANAELGTAYSVTHIRYVANDTKPESAYAYMALKLIERLARGGEFPAYTPVAGDNAA